MIDFFLYPIITHCKLGSSSTKYCTRIRVSLTELKTKVLVVSYGSHALEGYPFAQAAAHDYSCHKLV